MRSDTKRIISLGISVIVALKLFSFGLSFPSYPFRLTGDAYSYLDIAKHFTDWSSVLSFAGDRTVGFPFLEFLVQKVVSLFTSQNNVLAWINSIGLALLVTHIATAWFFARWARNANLVQTENMMLVLFIFFATYPALIGHTTVPLSDTLATDLVVCALVSLHAALAINIGKQAFLWTGLSAFFWGFAILVRPGNLWGVTAALAAGMVLSLLIARNKAAVICATALGCILLLAPFSYNCTQKYGSLCLQSPTTFEPLRSAQSGLRGARTLWEMTSLASGQIPTLPDDIMFTNYFQRCQLQTIVGIDDSSLTGCLITRPLALPAYTVKKWIGLLDHFRFTPYLEKATPFWLRWLSRAYDSMAWIGLALFFVMLFQATKPAHRAAIKDRLITPITPALLIVYSVVMLAQHTALHVEDRYGFPIIPLCAVVLAAYAEKSIQSYRTFGFQKVVPWALYCISAWAIFIAQIIIWDNTTYY